MPEVDEQKNPFLAALGERVRTITVRQGQPLVRLSTANMSEGMYFASVQRAGTTLATRRFVVTGR